MMFIRPLGVIRKSVKMINYFLSLLKQYSLNTYDYTKFSSILSQPKKASYIVKIMENTLGEYREGIVNEVVTFLVILSSHPCDVQLKALDLLNKIAAFAFTTSEPKEYLEMMLYLLIKSSFARINHLLKSS
ncbi:hypothetical protein [Stygiolobus azoricus]|uniref:Uncharacterized protein n=1 Tax=Stygiolobus azoricus TaxID=41675 RepID=A0A650CSF8_9CREN|nr:hypothetical protein [Stygiolobus azoricus]QGR20417.1 hypothetical protein D1868_10765 [Stygiolobus azoricus]